MKEQLIHILDQSVCLSRKQMKEYVGGAMLAEEMHAVEIHLNSCPLCSMAMEGFEEHSDAALEAIASLNSGFLKEHFANIAPQIHLNSMAPAAAMSGSAVRQKRGGIQPLWRTASIAASILLAFGVLWYMEFGRTPKTTSSRIAMADEKAGTTGLLRPQQYKAKLPERSEGIANQAPSPVVKQTVIADIQEKKVREDVPSPETKPGAGYVVQNDYAAEPTMGAAAPSVAAEEAPKNLKDVTVTSKRYSAPLIAPSSPGIRSYKAPAALERGAAGGTADLPKLSTQATTRRSSDDLIVAGGRSSRTDYIVDGVQMKSSAITKTETDEASPMELGDASFDKGKYGAALTHYKQSMNSGNARERHQAAIKAAQCYAALGNKSKAEELLLNVINDGAGPERRAARRALRSLE